MKINKTLQNKSNLSLPMWGVYINTVLGIGVKRIHCVSLETLITVYTYWLVWAVSQFLARFCAIFWCPMPIVHCDLLLHFDWSPFRLEYNKQKIVLMYSLCTATHYNCDMQIFHSYYVSTITDMTCNFSMATNTYLPNYLSGM